MTESETHQKDRDDTSGDVGDSEKELDHKSESSREAPQGGRRPVHSGFLIWLAMLIAVASLALAAYSFSLQRSQPRAAEPNGPPASEFQALADRVDRMRQERSTELEQLRADLGRLSSELESRASGPDAGDLAQQVDELSARFERLQSERNTDLGGMRSRIEALESEVGRRLERFQLRLSNVGSDLDRADHDLVTRLRLIEVDSLFAIAQNHLAVSPDRDVALKAWERAMERLAALEGADFTDLKETARREFRQLQKYRPPDVGVHVERLLGMADAVAEWPVETVQPGQQSAETGTAEGWRARLGQVVGSLVRVESVDREFLGPDEVDLARERVASTLQTAALAMVRSRPELARRLMDEAVDAARRVFDSEATKVSEALAWLEDVAASSSRLEPPDLADSRVEISRLLGELR